MPYIEHNSRVHLDVVLRPMCDKIINGDSIGPGDMNYLISQMCLAYTLRGVLSYTKLNDIVGLLECIKQEFYRRKVAPYEENKMHVNGDIYD